ncbi:MAG: 50S ribosomal protein L11 methyltransferase [Deltaproteobacteria bacterium]|nr:50S ribosomal protein L11 methyltransferase [Deltaproteobacteria bacterium]
MRPETLLTIYEVRVKDPGSFGFLEAAPDPQEILGPDLAGLHLEGDFAFIFFVNDYDLSPFLKLWPALELRQIHRLRYDQWQDGAVMEPLTIGPLKILPLTDLKVAPSVSYGLEPIYIDPGLAFGYGGHPTTKASLSLLSRLLKPGSLVEPKLAKALDLGSGTGVLSLAAARLGVRAVLGVDHSHLAVQCAVNNAKINGLSDKIRFVRGLAQDYAHEPGELVLANVPLFVQMDLLEVGAFSNRDYLIFSGLLPGEEETFLTALSQKYPSPTKLVDLTRDDRWVTGLVDFNG